MRNFLYSFCLLFVFTASPLFSQNKVVHFKKLIEFLPAAQPDSLTRKKPTGSTQTVMGMSTSEAEVTYEAKNQEESLGTRSVRVSIKDMSLIPYAAMAMAYQQSYESESEDGYEKSLTVKDKYKGKESASTGENKNLRIEFSVDNRFMIEVNVEGSVNRYLAMQLINSMKLEDLEKIKPE